MEDYRAEEALEESPDRREILTPLTIEIAKQRGYPAAREPSSLQ